MIYHKNEMFELTHTFHQVDDVIHIFLELA